MAHVSPAEPPEMQEVIDCMDRWTRTKGYAPNAWQTMLRRPKVFLAYRNLHTAVMMDEGEVPKALKFMVAEVVSDFAGCSYCTVHNAENAMYIADVPAQKVEALRGYQTSPLFSPSERSALALAEAAGSHPPAVQEAHFTELKKHFSETAIVEIVAVISLLGWLNRWNQTLATELEPESAAFEERYLSESAGAASAATDTMP